MAKPGLSGQDKEQGDLRDEAIPLPEGLQRPRLGPYDKDTGRLDGGEAIERKQDGIN
jgi:hypothetical protein